MIGYKSIRLLVGITCINVFGCSTTAHLYPVEGPLSQLKPPPVIQATATGIMGNTGDISLTMPNGERCEGRWSSAAGTSVSYGTGSLFGTYGAIYGSGISVGTNAGENRGQAMLVCNAGTVIDVEFITGSGTANGFGFAKDNKGNVYKVIF